MRKLLFITIIYLFYGCDKKDSLILEKTLKISPTISSLVNLDHTSEGFLVTLKNGNIIHFFRQDTSISGDHIGNSGGIYKRVSYNNGRTWTLPTIIYNDEFDDRNVRGGITGNGDIIIFFRRYQANILKAIDLNYIISTDGGETFSKRKHLDFSFDATISEVWIDNFLQIDKNKYLIPIHGVGYCEMKTFSIVNNHLSFDLDGWVWDKSITMPLGIDEPYICKKGNDLICLFRDESETDKANYYQSISSDLGQTWSNPERTNIALPYFCPSPLIISDPVIENDIIVVATDRRENQVFNSMIWIYNNSFESVFYSPLNYTLLTTFIRPKPNTYRFYGYPIATKMINGNWLVIITESSFDGINEDADFYQFEILL